MIKCNAKVKFSMMTDAENEDQIIKLANSLSLQRWDEEMDSLDLGDSMGVFIRAATEDFYRGDLDFIYMGQGFFVRMEMDFDLFNWTGINT